MADQLMSAAPDDDPELAAALVAEHYAHAEVAIVWMAGSAEGWRIEHANPNAMRVLGVTTFADLRALPLPAPPPRAAPPTIATELTAAELLSVARLVAEHDGRLDQLATVIGPRFSARRFTTPRLTGVQLVGRYGDLAAEGRRSLEAAQKIVMAYFEHTGVEVFMKDIEGRYILANDNFRQARTRQFGDILGSTDDDLQQPETAARFVREDREVLSTGVPLEIERIDERADGPHVFRVVKFPVRDVNQAIIGVGGVATDVTDALRSEAALAVSQEQFRLTFSHASEGIAVVSLDSVLLQVNDRLCEILGRSRDQLVGQRGQQFDHPSNTPSFEEWDRRLRETGNLALDRVLVRPDGSTVSVRVSTGLVRNPAGDPLHYVSMVTDETERRELERRARQAEKLEAVGQLAGGIAHDVNNLLGGILGYTELVKAGQVEQEMIDHCEQVIAAALRAADYTSRLLAFARPAEHANERFDLHDIVADVVHMLRHSSDAGIEVVTDLTAGNSRVTGNPNQIHGALLNLGLNARDAIDGPGTITFRSFNPEPGTVALDVLDTGVGIPADRIDRVFDPFFTTKAEGRGTGLGLTSVLAAVHHHHGTVSIDSMPGLGTRLRCELPVAVPTPEAPAARAGDELPAGTRVLVVDDDEIVRYVVAETLRLSGCEVAEAEDGMAAIAAMERGAVPQVAVFDLRMPRMGGDALFDVLRTRWPQVATVLMSGFGGDVGADELRQRGVGAVLQKPFKGQELVATVARCVQPA